MKKLICLILSFAFILSIFTSCKQNGKDTSTKEESTTKIYETTVNIETSDNTTLEVSTPKVTTGSTTPTSESATDTTGESTTVESTIFESESTTEIYGDHEAVGDLYYALVNDKFYEVLGPTNSLIITSASIRSAINGYPVKRIKDDAFAYCYNLKSVTIPVTIEHIGDNAFYDCENLVSIQIPKSVKYIGKNTFKNCVKLESITVANDNQNFKSVDGVLLSKDGKVLLCYPQNKAGEQFVVPPDVEVVVEYAVSNAKNLKTVVLLEGLKVILDYAFFNVNIESVRIPESVNYIGEYAFGSTALTSFHIPKYTIVSPLFLAFSNNITSVTVDEDHIAYTIIDGVMFSKDLKMLVWYPFFLTEDIYRIPEGVNSIGEYAFANVVADNIILPESMTSISKRAFSLSLIKNVTIPDTVTTIEEEAFCFSGIESLTIPQSVTSIGDRAFAICMMLENTVIPESVIEIGSYAFQGNPKLNIYLVVTEKPSGWADNWNGSTKVIWGDNSVG